MFSFEIKGAKTEGGCQAPGRRMSVGLVELSVIIQGTWKLMSDDKRDFWFKIQTADEIHGLQQRSSR